MAADLIGVLAAAALGSVVAGAVFYLVLRVPSEKCSTLGVEHFY